MPAEMTSEKFSADVQQPLDDLFASMARVEYLTV